MRSLRKRREERRAMRFTVFCPQLGEHASTRASRRGPMCTACGTAPVPSRRHVRLHFKHGRVFTDDGEDVTHHLLRTEAS